MTDQELIDRAVEVRDRAYAKYSNYRVGAALVDEHGNVHVGCNVENAAYPQGSCAEAGAISTMVAAGGTNKKPKNVGFSNARENHRRIPVVI